MTTKTDPFLGLQYGDVKGADNWNIWADTNLIKIGAVTHIYVKSATTSLPGLVVNGDRYIVPSGPSANQIAAGVEGTYNYFTPSAGWRAAVQDTKQFLTFDGTAWLDEDDYGFLPPISCVYAFNATDADMIAIGQNAAMIVSNAGKTATYTVQSGLATLPGNSYEVAQTVIPISTIDFSTGKKVVEGVLTFDSPLTSTGELSVGLLVTSSTSTQAGAYITTTSSGSNLNLYVYGSSTLISVGAVTSPCTVGFCFDSSTNTLTAVVNGTPVNITGTGGGSYVPAPYFILAKGKESTDPTPVNIADAGKTVSVTTHIDAASIVQNYGAGATDICGNLI